MSSSRLPLRFGALGKQRMPAPPPSGLFPPLRNGGNTPPPGADTPPAPRRRERRYRPTDVPGSPEEEEVFASMVTQAPTKGSRVERSDETEQQSRPPQQQQRRQDDAEGRQQRPSRRPEEEQQQQSRPSPSSRQQQRPRPDDAEGRQQQSRPPPSSRRRPDADAEGSRHQPSRKQRPEKEQQPRSLLWRPEDAAYFGTYDPSKDRSLWGPGPTGEDTYEKNKEKKDASLAINRLLIKSRNAEDILELYQTRRAQFDTVNLATAAHRLGRFWGPEDNDEPLARVLVERASSSAKEPRHVANVAWAAARLGFEWGAVRVEDGGKRKKVQKEVNPFDSLAVSAMAEIAKFNAQDVANTAWAFATARGVEDNDELFGALGRHSVASIQLFDAQNLANTVWAFATAEVAAPDLYAAVSKELQRRLETQVVGTRELGTVAWAFAKSSNAAPELFEAIARSLIANNFKKDALSAQSISNLAWAFARANAPQEKNEFFGELARLAGEEVAWGPQAMATTVWAFAKMDVRAPKFFSAVAWAAPEMIADFNGQDLSNTAWAFTKMEFEAPLLFQAMQRRAVEGEMSTTEQLVLTEATEFQTDRAEIRSKRQAVKEKRQLDRGKMIELNRATRRAKAIARAIQQARDDSQLASAASSETQPHGGDGNDHAPLSSSSSSSEDQQQQQQPPGDDNDDHAAVSAPSEDQQQPPHGDDGSLLPR